MRTAHQDPRVTAATPLDSTSTSTPTPVLPPTSSCSQALLSHRHLDYAMVTSDHHNNPDVMFYALANSSKEGVLNNGLFYFQHPSADERGAQWERGERERKGLKRSEVSKLVDQKLLLRSAVLHIIIMAESVHCTLRLQQLQHAAWMSEKYT